MKSTPTDSCEPTVLEGVATSRPKATGKKKKSKLLYRGYFNLGSEILIRRAYAYTELQAKTLMIRRIAGEKKLSGMGGLFRVFDGHLENYKIELEYPDAILE